MKLIIWSIFALLLIFAAAWSVFSWRFSREVAALETRLSRAATAEIRKDLPAQVRAFAARGMMGAAPVRQVSFTQSAEMLLQLDGAWKPVTSSQNVSTTAPGFVWRGVMKFGPIPIVKVIDSYVAGRGLLDVRLLGAFRMDAFEGETADLAEAYRYLAELPWAPDAILLNREIDWEVLPDGFAASVETRGGWARVAFKLDADGDVVSMVAADRPATQPDGSLKPMEWRGTFAAYREIGGRRVPTEAEVGYVWDTGYAAYYRGRVTGYSVAASSAN